MSESNKLTIDHIESLAACADVEFVHVTSNPSTRIDVKRVLRQLAQVMRENAQLKDALFAADNVIRAIRHRDARWIDDVLVTKCLELTSNALSHKDTNHIGESHKMVYHSEDMLEMVPDAGNATKDTEENNG